MSGPHIFKLRKLLERFRELFERGDLDGARRVIREALELDPDNTDLLCHLGRVELQRGDLPAARAGYERSLAIDAGHVQTRYDLAYVRIEESRYREAEALLLGLLEELPDSIEALTELAYLYRVTGRLGMAVASYRQALDMEPSNAHVLVAYAVSLKEWGSLEEAELVLGRVEQALLEDEHGAGTRRAYDRLVRELEFGAEIGLKEELYLNHGAVLLGTASDDGIDVPAYFFYHMDRGEVASTVLRFVALERALGWQIEAVCSVNLESVPLAWMVGELLGCPVLQGPQQVALESGEGGASIERVLLVEALTGGDGEERTTLAETWRESGVLPISFACILNMSGDESQPCPDIVGVAVPLGGSLPWTREDAFELEQREVVDPAAELEDLARIGTSLAALAEQRLPEHNLGEQLRFYAVTHRKLRPDLERGPGNLVQITPFLEQLPAREQVLDCLRGEDPERIAAALARLGRGEDLADDELDELIVLFRRRADARPRIDVLLREFAPGTYREALEGMLGESEDQDVRRDALQALIDLDQPESVAALLELLESEDESAVFDAVTTGPWGVLPLVEGHPRFSEIVLKLLQRGHSAAVATFAYLTFREDDRFVEQALGSLAHPDFVLCRAAMLYLAQLRFPLPPRRLARLLKHREADVVIAACALVRRSPKGSCRWRLMRLVRGGAPEVVGAAIRALAAHWPASACRALERRLLARDQRDASSALCEAVATLGEPLLGRSLALLLESGRWLPEDAHRGDVVRALSRSGATAALLPVRYLLRGMNTPPAVALDLLDSCGDASDEHIIEPLLGGGVDLQYRVAASLCRLGLMTYMEVLEDGLKSPSAERFLAACTAIAHVDGPAAATRLLDALTRPDGVSGILEAMEVWMSRGTLESRLAALPGSLRERLGYLLAKAVHQSEGERRMRVLRVIETIGVENGAPDPAIWLKMDSELSLLVSVLEHMRSHPSSRWARPAQRLLEHESLRVRSLASVLAAKD